MTSRPEEDPQLPMAVQTQVCAIIMRASALRRPSAVLPVPKEPALCSGRERGHDKPAVVYQRHCLRVQVSLRHRCTEERPASYSGGHLHRVPWATTPDRYPVPHNQDFSTHLAGRLVDLVRGYHQVPVHPADVPKTAVVTPFGLFEFLRMPFGLKNAAQSFQ